MWGRVVQEIRKAGPKKIAIIAIVAAVAIVFAYGDNSSDDYAGGATLPRATLIAHMHTRALAPGHTLTRSGRP